jgi:hypothetical protein
MSASIDDTFEDRLDGCRYKWKSGKVEKWKKLSDGSHQVEEVGFGAGKVVLTDFRS